MTNIRTYSELITIPTFIERYRYLKIGGRVGEDTFGYERYFNQIFYKSKEWKDIRDYVIVRDLGRDLAMECYDILSNIIVHHMNPITMRDIEQHSDILLNPDFLVSTSLNTHNAIHYGDESLLINAEPIIRTPNDTCPWKRG